MTKEQKEIIENTLLSEDEIQKHLRSRKSAFWKESHNNSSDQLQERISEGWEIEAVLKTKTKVYKTKPLDIAFEDKVWSLFAQLGFKIMNKDRFFSIFYDRREPEAKHNFNIIAKDDETLLLIDCRTSLKNTVQDFKSLLDDIKHRKAGIARALTNLFPGDKPKFKYILATSNISVAEDNDGRLKNVDGIHFSEEIIDYYISLCSQLGVAARYQLLGSIFAGQDIPDLDNKIPAIEGKMGGHTYYSFSIEPEKLLKISYVLHRNRANENMMPTYQRLIKKSRLKEIHDFVDLGHGYFPNSIIINIVSDKGKSLIFEKSSSQIPESISKIGILHLPKKYRSAYVIDGQHRLYGYSNSQYKSTNTIPVVALINLDRAEQVRLFMQINENQKPVSKDLRNTLDADLLWESENYVDQIKALKSRIAINLGENRKSPFYGKISIGEDKRLISTQQIGITLSKGAFLGKVKAKEIEKPGTFFNGNLQKAYDKISDFLFGIFHHLKVELEDLWESDGNIILINKGFYGITMLLNDIVNHLINEHTINFNSSANSIVEKVKPYLTAVVDFYRSISETKIAELKTAYGTPGDIKYLRALQIHTREYFPDIVYEGLEDYLKKEEKENNETAFKYIREIENLFKSTIREKLEEEFGQAWFKKGVPEKVYAEAINRAATKNREIESIEDEVEPWDQLHLIDYREIVHKNWQKLFETLYTKPSEKKLSGGKEVKTKWMVELNRIRNQNFHTYYVTSEELSFIQEIYDWLVTPKYYE